MKNNKIDNILIKGDEVVQETRLLITGTNKTYSAVEDAHDYRYFPTSDLRIDNC